MAALMAGAVGVLLACGTYLLLRGRSFSVIAGLVLLSYAVNLFLLGMGRLSVSTPPVVTDAGGPYADPLPQALVLTAIVIGFGMTAFVVALSLRAYLTFGSDHVDARESPPAGSKP
jgi:multicomponent K+:H+ antiporter subunit C